MTPTIDKAAFAALVRRNGIPLTEQDIDCLYEGYYWFERVVADLDQSAGAEAEPALIFIPIPEAVSCRL